MRGAELSLGDHCEQWLCGRSGALAWFGGEPELLPTRRPPPIIGATCLGHIDIIKLLIHRGADLEVTYTNIVFEDRVPLQEARAVHAAIHSRNVEALLVLLQGGENPNSTDARGPTPLMAVFFDAVPAAEQLEMVEALLIAGGDLLKANERNGGLPIHYAADSGATFPIGKMLSCAPATLYFTDYHGMSPLTAAAASEGHEDTVSALLSAERNDPEAWELDAYTALREAAIKGEESVVRVLLEEGLEEVGGVSSIPEVLLISVERSHVGVLRLLLNVQGEEAQETWARTRVYVIRSDIISTAVTPEPILHVAAMHCACRIASVLLSAGADEHATAAQRVNDVIGRLVGAGPRKAARAAAVGRMMERGPAFRARSWAWPTKAEAAVLGDGRATRSTSSSVRAPVRGVRMLPRKDCSFFRRALERYVLEVCDGQT